MRYTKLTDRDLVATIAGEVNTRAIYRGSLVELLREASRGGGQYLKIAAAHELVNRALFEATVSSDALISPGAVRDYLRLKLIAYEHEVFVVLFLDAQNRVIKAVEMFRGTLTQTSVYPREVVKEALKWNAASVIFCHNHPSGEATPSAADRSLTQALKEALALIDVRVLDHIVVAGNQYMSFVERGLL